MRKKDDWICSGTTNIWNSLCGLCGLHASARNFFEMLISEPIYSLKKRPFIFDVTVYFHRKHLFLCILIVNFFICQAKNRGFCEYLCFEKLIKNGRFFRAHFLLSA